MPVPATLDEFIADLEKLQSTGIIPLSLGEQWTTVHLFETILLASLGPEKYSGLWLGKTDWNGPEVRQALVNYEKVLRYTNSDSSTLSWQDASQLVVTGDAAFNIMGDWAEAYYKELGKVSRVDYGWTPVPGTSGVFQFLSDSFVLPVGAPNRDGAIAWLKLAGSREGQDAFNPVKGSIPARSDADRSLYDEYLQSAMDDWKKDIVVGSLYHGVVANDSWKTEINTDLGIFLTDKDIDKLQAALVSACKSSGPCQ
jgi:glucose/mannose transport system substrate-binding protein